MRAPRAENRTPGLPGFVDDRMGRGLELLPLSEPDPRFVRRPGPPGKRGIAP